MYKKILSLVLALTMAASMAVTSMAATTKTTAKESTKVTTQTTTKKKKTSSKGYDYCKTALSKNKLALNMHNTFVAGLHKQANSMSVDVKGYSQKDIEKAYVLSMTMIMEQHPEIFWLDTMQNFVVSDGKLVFYPRPAKGYGTASADGTRPSAIDKDAIASTTAKMDKAVAKMTGKTKYDLIKSIHDTIIKGSEYPANPSKATHNQHQAVGPLVEGKSVCDGYAKAFKYACDKKGIQCILVSGEATNEVGDSGTHAWNYVKMEDGKWYQVDTDWDDPQTKGGNSVSRLVYDYFMKGKIKDDLRKVDSSIVKYPALSASDYKAA